jgi:hypothetical protein
MGDFDFTFRCRGGRVPLGRILLRRGQELATNFDLEFRYRAVSGGWYVTVDGPLPSVQALIQPIVVQLAPLADGFPKPKSRSQRRRVAQRLIDDYCNGVAGIREMVEDVSRQLGGTPNSYFFDEGSATHLSAQVRDFERSMILFHNGLMSASELAEGAHMATEALLKACLPPNERRGSFAELLGRVAEAADLAPEHTQTLLKLKDRRKMAKHKGQRVKHAEMAADVGDVIGALHCLFRHLRVKRGSEPANKPLQPPALRAAAERPSR